MVTVASFEASNGNTMITGQEPDEDWLRRFREIIIIYNENRAPDPFMKWFRQRDSEQFFADEFQKSWRFSSSRVLTRELLRRMRLRT